MREALAVYLKGVAMGVADVVPGVSGATIALIVGIYDRLLGAITAIDPRVFRSAAIRDPEARTRLRAELERMDLPFLVTLGAGIATSIAALSRVLYVAATAYPVPTYGFFFGLIAASAVVLYGQVETWTGRRAAVSVAALALAFSVSGATAGTTAHGPVAIFLAGAISVCAMILPGVSGSFFLLLLGQYEYVTGTVSAFVDGVIGLLAGDGLAPVIETGSVLAVFAAGAAVGLVTMAHAVKGALERDRTTTLAGLVSLMVGSLRLPFETVATNLGQSPVETPVAAVLAGVGGVGVVLLVDRYTDDLEY